MVKKDEENCCAEFYSVLLGDKQVCLIAYDTCMLLKIIEHSVWLWHLCFEGLKQSHAPAVAHKVLLSITNWHPQNYLDDVLHPSEVQDRILERLGP